MRLIITFILIILFASHGNANNFKIAENRQDNGLKGNVKRVVTIEYEAQEENGKLVKGKKTDYEIDLLFDKEGRLLKRNRVCYVLPTGKEVFKYDDKGNFIEYQYYITDDFIEIDKPIEYNENGRVSKMARFEKGKEIGNAMVIYDNDVRVKKLIYWNSNIDYPETMIFKYEEAGETVSFTIPIAFSSYVVSNKYLEYDQQKNWISGTKIYEDLREKRIIARTIVERLIEYY